MCVCVCVGGGGSFFSQNKPVIIMLIPVPNKPYAVSVDVKHHDYYIIIIAVAEGLQAVVA